MVINKKMNRKGFIVDLLGYTVILFGLAIVIVVVYYVLSQFNTAWQADALIPTESKEIIQFQTTNFVPVWDGFIVVAVIGYMVALILTASFLPSHPVFAMFGMLFLIIFGLIGVRLANAYYSFASSTGMSDSANAFTNIAFTMNNLPMFVVVFGLIFIIVLYATTKNQGVGL